MKGGDRFTGEDGVSLVELLTAMAVGSVVLAFVAGTVVNALASQRRQTAQGAALNGARLAFERTTRDIRAADPLQLAALDAIRLGVRAADGTVRSVGYQRAGDRLVATDAAGHSRDLVADLAGGQPVFLFHLADGTTATGTHYVDPRSVRAITVRLQVEPRAAGRVVDLASRVLLRNAAP